MNKPIGIVEVVVSRYTLQDFKIPYKCVLTIPVPAQFIIKEALLGEGLLLKADDHGNIAGMFAVGKDGEKK